MPETVYFQRGCVAMRRLLSVIERRPRMSAADGGDEPTSVAGELRLQNISFAYPTRPDLPVLKRCGAHSELLQC